jgi:AraC family transcriptional regulator
VLFEDDECCIALSIYPPGLTQERHAHEYPSAALLLAGSLLEETDSGAAVAGHASVGLKPDGCTHRNVYGREGAIVLSMSIQSPRLWSAGGATHDWGWERGRHSLAGMAASALRGQFACADLASELLAGRTAFAKKFPSPPIWLRRAHEEIMDTPDVPLEELAARAGVHRVHMCRSFSRFYGEGIGALRMRRRAELAISAYLHANAPAAAAAADAGFADQSHFARTVKRLFGATPQSLKRVARDVT